MTENGCATTPDLTDLKVKAIVLLVPAFSAHIIIKVFLHIADFS